MADTGVINLILQVAQSYMIYLLPIIGIMSGIIFIITWLMSITLGFGRRTFKG